MKLILSAKAATKLKLSVTTINDFNPDIDTWRIDLLTLRKRSIFFVVNEKSLYTHICSLKSGIRGIHEKLSVNQDQQNIQYIKYLNRSIISSLNNMKAMVAKIDKYANVTNEQIEQAINNSGFKYLSDFTPSEAHLKYLQKSEN